MRHERLRILRFGGARDQELLTLKGVVRRGSRRRMSFSVTTSLLELFSNTRGEGQTSYASASGPGSLPRGRIM